MVNIELDANAAFAPHRATTWTLQRSPASRHLLAHANLVNCVIRGPSIRLDVTACLVQCCLAIDARSARSFSMCRKSARSTIGFVLAVAARCASAARPGKSQAEAQAATVAATALRISRRGLFPEKWPCGRQGKCCLWCAWTRRSKVSALPS